MGPEVWIMIAGAVVALAGLFMLLKGSTTPGKGSFKLLGAEIHLATPTSFMVLALGAGMIIAPLIFSRMTPDEPDAAPALATPATSELAGISDAEAPPAVAEPAPTAPSGPKPPRTKAAEAMLPPGQVATVDNPDCGVASCRDICVRIPARARIDVVNAQIREAGADYCAEPDCSVGWSGWRDGHTATVQDASLMVCRTAKNWSHDRTRWAKLTVRYR